MNTPNEVDHPAALSSAMHSLWSNVTTASIFLTGIIPTICTGTHNGDLIKCGQDYGIWLVLLTFGAIGGGFVVRGAQRAYAGPAKDGQPPAPNGPQGPRTT